MSSPNENEKGYIFNHRQANWGEYLILAGLICGLVSGGVLLTHMPSETDWSTFLFEDRVGRWGVTVPGLAAIVLCAWGSLHSSPFRVIQDLTTRVQKF